MRVERRAILVQKASMPEAHAPLPVSNVRLEPISLQVLIVLVVFVIVRLEVVVFELSILVNRSHRSYCSLLDMDRRSIFLLTLHTWLEGGYRRFRTVRDVR